MYGSRAFCVLNAIKSSFPPSDPSEDDGPHVQTPLSAFWAKALTMVHFVSIRNGCIITPSLRGRGIPPPGNQCN